MRTWIIAAGIMAAGIVLGCALLGQAALEVQQSKRSVIVKGLAERDVESNLAIWPLKFVATGSDIRALQEEMARNQHQVMEFLTRRGFEAAEIRLSPLKVKDLLAQEYRQQTSLDYRYILEAQVVLKTNKVTLAEETSRMLSSLVEQGVALEGGRGPEFLFTDITEVKPDMLTEATRNAREAAKRFAEDSGSQVGPIRTANQGVFTVLSEDGREENRYDQQEPSSLRKKLRVVVTVEYGLVD
jgi:hypothetical protein